MKLLILSALTLFAFAQSAQATQSVSKRCESQAIKFADAELVSTDGEGTYDKGGIISGACVLSANKAIVICEIGASKSEGAASDTYRVVMNNKCNRMLRIDLTGEE